MYRRSSSGNNRNENNTYSNNGQKSPRREKSPHYRGNTPNRNQYGSTNSRNLSGNGSRNSLGKSSSGRGRCDRCNSSAHASEYSDMYGYTHSGTTCETCGLRHLTKYHRQRSSSGHRSQQRKAVIRNHQVVLEDQNSGSQNLTEEQAPPRFQSDNFESIFGGKN